MTEVKRLRVLAGGPVHWCKAYSIRPWVKSLRGMAAHPPTRELFDVDFYASDNSSDDAFADMLRRGYKDLRVEHVDDPQDPRLPIYARIAASENQQRDAFLSGGYDLMLSVECDVLPQPDALMQLWEHLTANELDCTQGYYYEGFTAAAWAKHPFWLMGLSLLRRPVLEAIPFRFELQRPNGAPDAFFGHDLKARGFRYGFAPGAAGVHLRRIQGGVQGSGWDLISDDLARHLRHSREVLGE